MNHTSGPRDVEAALSWFDSAPRPSRPAVASLHAHEDRAADIKGGWGDVCVFDAATVRRLPLFSGLHDAAFEVVVKSADERWAEPILKQAPDLDRRLRAAARERVQSL